MRMIRHMSMNIEGCLRNHQGKKITIMDRDDGTRATDKEARQFLQECLAKGWRVIPMDADGCTTFDYQKGCPGHEITGYKDKDYGYVITVEAYDAMPEEEQKGYESIWE